MGILYSDLLNVTSELSILFVEDYQPFADEMDKILRELFYDVVIVSDGLQGIESYKAYYEKNNRYFDVVITDICMPKMDGVELSKEIYKINNQQNTIVISSYTESEDLIELLNIGIKRFIKKPINHDELCSALYHVSCDCACSLESSSIAKKFISLGSDYIWDNEQNLLLHHDKEVHCTKYELLLLEFFITHQKRVCTPEMIIDYFLSHNEEVTAKSIRNLVLNIRKKTYAECIQNIYGLGYSLYGK